jgi:hypothetical protein
MPDCHRTIEAERNRLVEWFIGRWHAAGIETYAGVCGCREAQARNMIILSADKVNICGLCGRPTEMVPIESYTTIQIGDAWFVKKAAPHKTSD